MAPSRALHSSPQRKTVPDDRYAMADASSQDVSDNSQRGAVQTASPLSVLPLRMVLRSLAITTISASPLLLSPSLKIMSSLAHTKNSILSPDKNPLLKHFLKKTFYAQFCAGETQKEVERTVSRLKQIGFTGVILGYAREVVMTEDQARNLASCNEAAQAEECVESEIKPWTRGTLETVRLAEPGDFVALKFTGAGRQALYHLTENMPPSLALMEAIDSICALAASRGVRLLFDAEQQAVQGGIDAWTLDYMKKYNTTPGHATVYGTYQAYLKSTPPTLLRHLASARAEGFTLGVKLVRGAYLGSDPREMIHDTKKDTDTAYNAIAKTLLTRHWDDPLSDSGPFPHVSLVLATHNAESVRLARAICDDGQVRTEVAFAQLQGMADEVSCELVCATKKSGLVPEHAQPGKTEQGKTLRAYKYLVWGSTGECMKYLLRRAQENRDAVERTKSGRDAMWAELLRRAKKAFGVAV